MRRAAVVVGLSVVAGCGLLGHDPSNELAALRADPMNTVEVDGATVVDSGETPGEAIGTPSLVHRTFAPVGQTIEDLAARLRTIAEDAGWEFYRTSRVTQSASKEIDGTSAGLSIALVESFDLVMVQLSSDG